MGTALLMFASAGAVWATITPVEPTPAGARTLADAMTASEGLVTDAGFETVPGSDVALAHGTSDALNEFPTNGPTFAILTNGDVNLADAPNEDEGSGMDLLGGNARGNTDLDVTVLKVDVDVPEGANCLSFDFKFFSEEFPEYADPESQFNDAFIAELDESTWTTEGSAISAPRNFAFDDDGGVISVKSSGVTSMSATEAEDTTYDGATALLRANAPVTPGSHSLYLSVFDQGDGIYDSAVFLDNLTVGFVPDVETQCASGAKSARFALTLSPSTASNAVGTDHTVTATLTDEGVHKVEALVEFTVSDANDTNGGDVTDSEGNATFTYLGENSGTDTIVACYDADDSGTCGDAGDPIASAKKTWTADVAEADLVVTKAGPSDPIHVGDSFSYTITVKNQGGAPAPDVLVTDDLPDGVVIESVSASPGSCGDADPVECPLGTIGPEDFATVTIDVIAEEPGELLNTATAETSDEDSLVSSETETTIVEAAPASGFSLTPSSATSPVGTTHTVTATLIRDGEPAPGAPILFDVTGANSAEGSGLTDAKGQATFTYTGENSGEDTVSACYDANIPPDGFCFGEGDVLESVSMTWTAVELPNFTLDLTPVNDRSPRGETHTVTAALTQDASGVPGKTIAFTVSGANEASGSATTNADGRATFTYTGTNVGIDTIAACYDADANGSCGDVGDASTSASKEWTQADLVVTKSDSPNPVKAGGTLTYTITVYNQGTADATNVHVVDTLPDGVTFTMVNASPEGSICTGTTTIDCGLGTIPEDETETVTIQVTPSAPGELVNAASASSDSEETTLLNNSDNEGTLVEPAEEVSSGPDLTVSKTANVGSVTVGGNVTYTIVVANVGDEDATSVSIVDQLPDGVTFVSADSLAATCNDDGDVYCNLEALAPDNSVTVTIVVTTTAVGEPSNRATAGGGEDDPTPENNAAEASVTVLPLLEEVPPPTPGPGIADLTLTKTAAPSVVNGGSFSYTLVVANKGPDPATGVVLTDKLPGGVSFGSASASQGSCSGGGTVSCSLGTIKAKSSATLTIGVTATSSGITTNEAKVAGAETDPNPGDNQAFATTRISPRIDLGVRGTVTPEAAQIGGELTYHVVVTNGGPDTAEGVLVPLAVPAGASFVSVTPSQGICVRDGTILCFLGRIASGGSAAVDLVLRSGTSGELVLPVSVSSDGGTDSNSANNAMSLTGGVAESFDLRLEMTSTPQRIGAGEWITYTINVTNVGPGAATGVKVVDTLPDSVSFVSCETTKGECTSRALLKVAAGSTVEARLGRLGAGDSERVKIVGRGTRSGTATNSATASGAGEDPALTGNNESTAQTPVSQNQFPPPADVPPPVFNESVDAAPKTGTVRFRRPGSNVFEVLTDGEQLPLGTEFDTTNGTMTLTSATDTAGAVQTAEFWDGFFVVTQTVVKQTSAITDLALTRGTFSACPSTRKFASFDQKPPKKKPPKGKSRPKAKKTATQRKLWGRGDGKFRTKGRYSSAAIRGTYWLTADRCDGTLTSVREGVVVVRDNVRRKSIILRAGKSYLARPKR
jgi:uncharacterized repeat protein (TIGR01451 family)